MIPVRSRIASRLVLAAVVTIGLLLASGVAARLNAAPASAATLPIQSPIAASTVWRSILGYRSRSSVKSKSAHSAQRRSAQRPITPSGGASELDRVCSIALALPAVNERLRPGV